LINNKIMLLWRKQSSASIGAHDNVEYFYYYTVWTVYIWCLMKSEITRARIRVAAAKVIERDGAGNLTLSKVAAEAGVSKGGLLYHYPSKHALLQGLLDHLLEKRSPLLDEQGSEDSVSHTFLLNKLIDADFDLPKDERIMAQGLIGASAENAELIAPAKYHVEAVFAKLGASKTVATPARTIFLASQGLQFLELLGLLSLNTAERKEIRRHLKAMAQELGPC
jgi:AcrR family transcriptional regulator